MRNSDIFDAYAKILESKDAITKKASDEAKEIEKLYNVEPEASEGMTYKKNIVELAHPDMAVVSPSYDKLNALVENLNERQNIMINLVNRMPTGNLTARKNAHQDLLLSIIKAANTVDDADEKELTLLSDACITNLSENGFKKEAAIPLAIWGVSALLGILYAQQHLPNANHGYESNYLRLKDSVEALVSSSSSWGVGYSVDESVKSDMKKLLDTMQEFHSTIYTKVNETISSVQKPQTAKESMEIGKEELTKTTAEAIKWMEEVLTDKLSLFNRIMSNFDNETYKKQHSQNKGKVTEVFEDLKLSGGFGLFTDKFDKVRKALKAYVESLQEMLGVLKSSQQFADKTQQEMSQAASSTEVAPAPKKEENFNPDEEMKKLLSLV